MVAAPPFRAMLRDRTCLAVVAVSIVCGFYVGACASAPPNPAPSLMSYALSILDDISTAQNAIIASHAAGALDTRVAATMLDGVDDANAEAGRCAESIRKIDAASEPVDRSLHVSDLSTCLGKMNEAIGRAFSVTLPAPLVAPMNQHAARITSRISTLQGALARVP